MSGVHLSWHRWPDQAKCARGVGYRILNKQSIARTPNVLLVRGNGFVRNQGRSNPALSALLTQWIGGGWPIVLYTSYQDVVPPKLRELLSVSPCCSCFWSPGESHVPCKVYYYGLQLNLPSCKQSKLHQCVEYDRFAKYLVDLIKDAHEPCRVTDERYNN